jgi:nucleolar protein TMA23
MDAAALLKSQGWRGKGFSLHPSNNEIGLSKPLLISRNKENRGVGQKPHYTSDQWWLDAFDQKLKGLDTSGGKGVVQSVIAGKLDVVAKCKGNGKYTGLYASFVRGETLEGTLSPEGTATPASSGEEGGTKEERKARRARRRLEKEERLRREAKEVKARRKAEERAAKKEKREVVEKGETKEERRARRAERRARKEARRKRREEKAKGG